MQSTAAEASRYASGGASFENFLADMGERRPSKDFLDRINNDGHYEPGNCCWATREQQDANKRSQLHNLVGRRYGKLVVKALYALKPARWHCVCDCGEETRSSSANLSSGKAKSCGSCVRKWDIRSKLHPLFESKRRFRPTREELVAHTTGEMATRPRCIRCKSRAASWSQKHQRLLKTCDVCAAENIRWQRELRRRRRALYAEAFSQPLETRERVARAKRRAG
jgi:hypothetical protein